MPAEHAVTPGIRSHRSSMSIGQEWLKQIAFGVAFLAAYLGLEQISSIGPTPPLVLTPWNPSLGLGVAALLIWRERVLPYLFLGPVLSELFIPDVPHSDVYGICLGLLMLAEALLIVASSRALARYASSHILDDSYAPALIVCAPIAFCAAILHMLLFNLVDVTSVEHFWEGVIRILVGDVIGIFIIAPLCWLLYTWRGRLPEIKITLEVIAQTALILGAVWLAFGENPLRASRYFYIVFLPMIWIALRSGAKGAIIMNFFVQISMVVSLSWAGHDEVDVTLFQAFLLVLAVSSLTLGMAVDQSRLATQRLRARESELAASLKVAATGELAGALAHELGHPLGAISNYAAALNHLIGKMSPSSEVVDVGNKLSREILRATDTLHRLREFFRSGSLVVEQVNISVLINDAVVLLKDRFEHNGICPMITVQAGLKNVLVDRIQIHAVIHNLLINAIDALKAVPADRRLLSVTASRDTESVIIAVDDSGKGVPNDVREHIFEPLTTTKKDGLGLGLAMSRSVVAAHGGRIFLGTSTLGGAKFVVILPIDHA